MYFNGTGIWGGETSSPPQKIKTYLGRYNGTLRAGVMLLNYHVQG